jgi:hypothetical protein
MHPAGVLAHRVRVAEMVVAVAEHARPLGHSGEHTLAFQESARAKIPAVQMQQVEAEEHQRVVPAGLERGLQSGKAGDAVLAQADEFAIQHRRPDRQLRDRVRDRRHAFRPVVAIAGE